MPGQRILQKRGYLKKRAIKICLLHYQNANNFLEQMLKDRVRWKNVFFAFMRLAKS